MKKIGMLFLLVLFALLIGSCQWYTDGGELLYNYKGEYKFEAPKTNPSFNATQIKNRVGVDSEGNVWILADSTSASVWFKGGYMLDYYGYPNWTKNPNGVAMNKIGTYAGKNVFGFKIPKEDISVLVGKVSDSDCIKQYGTPKGCFAFKFALDSAWTGQFAADEGSPYHLKGSSGVFINCAIDFNKPNSDPPYSPNK